MLLSIGRSVDRSVSLHEIESRSSSDPYHRHNIPWREDPPPGVDDGGHEFATRSCLTCRWKTLQGKITTTHIHTQCQMHRFACASSVSNDANRHHHHHHYFVDATSPLDRSSGVSTDRHHRPRDEYHPWIVSRFYSFDFTLGTVIDR